MVIQIQLHSNLVHGVEMPGVGGACLCKRQRDGAGQTPPPSRCCRVTVMSSHWHFYAMFLTARGQGIEQGLDLAGAAMLRSSISPALTAICSPLPLKLASTSTGWFHVIKESYAFLPRRKFCGLRGVEPSGLDFPCQGEGCGRAFSTPIGIATHR